jgi:hypothetical protein
MSEKSGSRWFVDEGPGLDRFGVVLALSVLSVTLLSLIDLDDATAGMRSEVGWTLVTIAVAATLAASLRASGVARRPRRFVEVLLLIGVIGVAAVPLVTLLTDSSVELANAGEPSILWSMVAIISPIVVLRRVMKQPTITLATLQGAVAVYLLFALAFNYGFLGLDNVSGGVPFFGVAESTSSFMYFSLSTITTVGYGDLAAVGDVGRFLASAEAVIGQVLLVTVVARLVSLYSKSSEPQAPTAGQSNPATVE